MNAINKIIIILALFFFLVSGFVMILLSINIMSPHAIPGYFIIKPLIGDLSSYDKAGLLKLLISGLGLVSASLLFLVFEIFPANSEKLVVLSDSEDGSITITKSSFLEILRRIGTSFSEVVQFQPKLLLLQKGKKVRIKAKATVSNSSNLLELGDKISEKIKAEISDKTGIEIDNCSISFKLKSTDTYEPNIEKDTE